MEYSNEMPRLGFSNDLVFSIVMKDARVARRVIEAITGRKVGEVRIHNTQQEERGSAFTRGVRLDVYMEDEDAVYDVEMQASHQDDLGMRYRLYQSMIDSKAIGKGAGFADLKKSFVIFLCTYDPLGLDLPMYTFEPTCLENRAAKLETGQQWLALNSRSWFRSSSPELRELLEYVNNGSITGSLSHMLDEAVDVANSIDDVRRKAMITLEQKRESERRAARKLGKAEERTSIADDLRRVTEKLVELDRIDDVLSLNRNLDRLEEFKAELGIE
mgnify:FL=1